MKKRQRERVEECLRQDAVVATARRRLKAAADDFEEAKTERDAITARADRDAHHDIVDAIVDAHHGFIRAGVEKCITPALNAVIINYIDLDLDILFDDDDGDASFPGGDGDPVDPRTLVLKDYKKTPPDDYIFLFNKRLEDSIPKDVLEAAVIAAFKREWRDLTLAITASLFLADFDDEDIERHTATRRRRGGSAVNQSRVRQSFEWHRYKDSMFGLMFFLPRDFMLTYFPDHKDKVLDLNDIVPDGRLETAIGAGADIPDDRLSTIEFTGLERKTVGLDVKPN